MHSAAEIGTSLAAQRTSTEAGLSYYRARYYDPQNGRFLGEDPLRFSIGLNFYAYVGNDPVDESDPSGLCPCGYHRVRLYISPNFFGPGKPDYHWYRLDSNGGWSSKHGGAPVGPQVLGSTPDQDAASAVAGQYTVFCGAMCAPNQGGLPIYNRAPWNDPDHIHTNNCFSYACDVLHPRGPTHMPQPGEGFGHPMPFPFKCVDAIQAAMLGGLTADPFEPLPLLPKK
jgi:RHS repeat-associated protein